MALSHDLFKAVVLASQSQISPDFLGSYVRYRLEPETGRMIFEGSIPLVITPNEQGIAFAPADFLETPLSPAKNI